MKRLNFFIFCVIELSLTACSTVSHDRYHHSNTNNNAYVVNGHHYSVLHNAKGYDEKGTATWYGKKLGRCRTASGEIYNPADMSAANKTLPFQTYVRVTNLRNNKQVVVRINDRGPFHKNCIIDLSYAAAAKIGMLSSGTTLVRVKAIEN